MDSKKVIRMRLEECSTARLKKMGKVVDDEIASLSKPILDATFAFPSLLEATSGTKIA